MGCVEGERERARERSGGNFLARKKINSQNWPIPGKRGVRSAGDDDEGAGGEDKTILAPSISAAAAASAASPKKGEFGNE